MAKNILRTAIALTVAMLTVPSQAAPPNSPTDFAAALYRSYITTIIAVIPKPAVETAWEAKWLTPHFRTALPALDEATGVDQIIQAQDTCPSWSTDIKTKLIASDATSASVAITLGAHTSGWHSLIANLKKQNGQWRLDGVSSEGKGKGGCS